MDLIMLDMMLDVGVLLDVIMFSLDIVLEIAIGSCNVNIGYAAVV